MLIYLGQSIDQKSESMVEYIEKAVIAPLIAQAFTVYRPINAFQFTPNNVLHRSRPPKQTYQDVEKIKDINDYAISAADLVIFAWDGASSWGLPLELERVIEDHKNFIFVDFSSHSTLPTYLHYLLFSVSTKEYTIPVTDTCPQETTKKIAGWLYHNINKVLRETEQYILKPHACIYYYEKDVKNESKN